MNNHNKRNQVLLVSAINFIIGFGGQILFLGYGIAITGIKSLADLIFPSLVVIASFVWLSAFTRKGLSHSEEPEYPAVAVTAIAWPSFMVAMSGVIYLLSFLGIKRA